MARVLGAPVSAPGIFTLDRSAHGTLDRPNHPVVVPAEPAGICACGRMGLVFAGRKAGGPASAYSDTSRELFWCVRRERGRLATSFDFDLDLYYSSLREDAVPFGYGSEFAVPLSEPIEPEPIERSIVSGPVASPAIEGPEPVVSVIIPCYRQAQYLPQAVRSVLDQTFRQVEAIVVDDGSPDDPRAQLEPFADDPRVRFIRQENAGVGRARNAGVKASRGAFLNFLDADDWLAPQFCERLVQSLSDSDDLGFVYCDLQHVVESEATAIDGEYSVGASRRLVNGNILPSLLMGGYFPPHTVLVRKAVLDQVGLFDAELGGHADWDLWLRISASGFRAHYIDEKLVYYRIHPASMSRNQEHMLDTRRRTLRKLMTNFPEKVAEGIHELTRSAEEQFAANRFLQEQLLVIRQGGGTGIDPASGLQADCWPRKSVAKPFPATPKSGGPKRNDWAMLSGNSTNTILKLNSG